MTAVAKRRKAAPRRARVAEQAHTVADEPAQPIDRDFAPPAPRAGSSIEAVTDASAPDRSETNSVIPDPGSERPSDAGT